MTLSHETVAAIIADAHRGGDSGAAHELIGVFLAIAHNLDRDQRAVLGYQLMRLAARLDPDTVGASSH
jgi:hypothetical protein